VLEVALFSSAFLIAASTDASSHALIERALGAMARQDTEAIARSLRGWASLGGDREALPPPLLEPGLDALRWTQEVGPFRLFVSRIGSRVRVGLHDPARVAGRVSAVIRLGSQEHPLIRLETASPGRREYRIEGPAAVEGVVVVRAYLAESTAAVPLREVVLDRARELPAPPTLTEPPVPERRSVVREAEALPWWFWAATGVAAFAVGAAVWQETRFEP
jgi:hypothetical protein